MTSYFGHCQFPAIILSPSTDRTLAFRYKLSNALMGHVQVSTKERKVGVSKAQESKGLIDVQPVRGRFFLRAILLP
jgi:hypothetical protein